MHHLDTVGRYVPSSLDVSRAAAERHRVLSALRERDPAPTPPVAGLRHRPRAWVHLVVARLS